MLGSVNSKHAYRFWMAIGFALINAAMFLHPMSPEDFLGQVSTSPLAMLIDAPGGLMVLFFWFGMSVCLAGIVGFIASRYPFQRADHASGSSWGAQIH